MSSAEDKDKKQAPAKTPAATDGPPLQTFAQVIAAIAARNISTASRYNELSGHEQGLVDMTIQSIDAQNKQGQNTAAVENAAQAAERYGLGTLVESLHRYVDGRSPSRTQRAQTFAEVIEAIRQRDPKSESASNYSQLSGHEQSLVDMVVQTIERQNMHGKNADAIEEGVKIAKGYGLGTFIEALHRYVDGRTEPTVTDMPGSGAGGYDTEQE